MPNKLGRLGQQSLQPGCDGEYVASGAIRLTRRDVGDGQMRRRDSAIAPTVVTKGLSSDGEIVTPCLELARVRHGSKINGANVVERAKKTTIHVDRRSPSLTQLIYPKKTTSSRTQTVFAPKNVYGSLNTLVCVLPLSIRITQSD